MSATCSCCNGDPDTVCSACGEHACWAGAMYCEDAPFAGVIRTPEPEPLPVPTPAQWAAWFRCCADEAAPWEMTKEHRFAFRRVAEHFEDGDIVKKAAGITGVDS